MAASQPTQILHAADDTGPEFRVPGRAYIIHLDGHAGDGKEWILQQKSPEQLNGVDVWISTDVRFDAIGVKTIILSPAFTYRLTGGTAGARAWIGIADPFELGSL